MQLYKYEAYKSIDWDVNDALQDISAVEKDLIKIRNHLTGIDDRAVSDLETMLKVLGMIKNGVSELPKM